MKHILKHTLVACALATAGLCATAQTVRIAQSGDAQSLDPHSRMETVQLGALGNVFEPLVTFDENLKMEPALATAWEQTSPTVWRFTLRKGVQFHDGTPFTADDVAFSIGRAQAPVSDILSLVDSIKQVRVIDTHTVEMETHTPFSILPQVLSMVFIMSKKWCEDNQATIPVDMRKGVENAASFKANGTGPYQVRERQPNVRTVFERSGNYWGEVQGNVQEVIFTPIGNDATRVAALLSGGVDIIEPVPVQDMGRINANPNVQVLSGPELRTIFLGMDQKRDELLYSSVKGKNPFKDKRVRQAFYQAIDIEGIKKTVMRGSSTPSANMVAPGISGFQQDLKRLPYDVEAAKKLLADAGYGQGFELTMNCPNDRYVNDEAICTATAGFLGRIGIKVNVTARPLALHSGIVARAETDFYLFGWSPTTYDSNFVFDYLVHTRGKNGRGSNNATGYSNAELDEKIVAMDTEIDKTKRDALIKSIWEVVQKERFYIPLHYQVLHVASIPKINVQLPPEPLIHFKKIKFEK